MLDKGETASNSRILLHLRKSALPLGLCSSVWDVTCSALAGQGCLEAKLVKGRSCSVRTNVCVFIMVSRAMGFHQ